MLRRASAFGLAVIVALVIFPGSQALAVTINFDTDANGSPLNAPSLFANPALTELYAPLGVHFSGPAPMSGGAILHQDSNFGVNARSSPNFLAFNRNALLSGGAPTDPETIRFDALQSQVSIFAAGGNSNDTFTLTAFNDANVVVGTSTIMTQQFALLAVSSAAGDIRRVVLTQTGDSTFVYDDLAFQSGGDQQAVPEPSSLVLLATAAASMVGRAFLRRKALAGSTE